MRTYVKVLTPMQTPRLRVRRVDLGLAVERAVSLAKGKTDCTIYVTHGGTVCNSYRYPAETECALIVAHNSGWAVVWCGRTNANKATCRGAAEACLPFSGDLFDHRLRDSVRIANAREYVINEAQAAFRPLEQLACAAPADTMGNSVIFIDT